MPTLTDYLESTIGGSAAVAVVKSTWVQLTNNSTTVTYVSTAATDSAGKFTINNLPAGSYSVATGPSATGPWTATGDTNYLVAPTAADNTSTFPGAVTVPSLTDTGLTAAQIPFADTGGLLATDATLTFNKTTKVAGASAVSVTGLTGAVAGGRFVGFTAYGPPTTGTFSVGDSVISGASGSVFVCKTAGTPGTWIVKDNRYNVLDYGAKGDGVTDDYPALSAAVTAAGNNGTVYFPPGTYIVGTTLSVGSGITLLGDSHATATIKQKGANTNLLAVVQIPDGAIGVRIMDLAIDGNRANNNGNTTGLNVVNQPTGLTADLQIVRVHFTGCSVRGCVVRGYRILIEGCSATNCGYDGFMVLYDYTNSANPATGIITKDVRILGCTAYSNNVTPNTFHGFSVLGPAKSGWGILVQDVSVVNCVASQNGTTGTGGVGGFRSVGGNFVGAESGVSNNVGCKNVSFIGCAATANADDGFWIQGSTGVQVIGCTVDGNYTGTGVQQKGFGIEAQASQETHIIGCKVMNVGAQGIIISSTDAAATTFAISSFGNSITDCVVDNCGLGTFSAGKASGIRVEQANDTYPTVGTRITNSYIRNNAQAGVEISVANDWIISGCQIEDNGAAAVVGAQQGITLFGSGGQMQLARGVISNCVIRDTRSAGARTQSYGVQDNSINVDNLLITDCHIINNVTGPLGLSGLANVTRSITGFNPAWPNAGPNPAIAATGVFVTNQSGIDCTVYVTAGASTCAITLGGNGTVVMTIPASGVGTVVVPANQSIALTYTVAPTWRWIGS